MIDVAGERVARMLGFTSNPIQTDAKGTRVMDFAGMIRLAPSLELEIAPKFLGIDETESNWREDFYYLATLSRHGRLLASERLRASGGAPQDLAALVARSLAGMYRDNRRKPLRAYRTTREISFSIEGDIDPPQQSRPDPYRTKKVPGRSRAWQPVVDLSNDVLGGLGVSYKSGMAAAPGYVVRTWETWEQLLTVAARFGFGSDSVLAQSEHELGTRQRSNFGKAVALNVRPDLLITTESRIILDAKYKTNSERGKLRISEADAYESLAFSKATNCDCVVLAYPSLPGERRRPLGQVELFEIVDIDNTRIYGVQIEVRGISRRGGLTLFSRQIQRDIQNLLKGAPRRFPRGYSVCEQ